MRDEIGRKEAIGKPFLQEVFQVDIVNSPDMMKIYLGVHKIPRQHQSLSGLNPSLFNTQAGFLGSVLLVRRRSGEDSKRINQPVVIKSPVSDTDVKRVAR